MPERATTEDVVTRMLRRAPVVTLVALLAAAVTVALLSSWTRAGSVALAGGVVVGALSAGLGAVRWLLGQHLSAVMPGAFMILLTVVVLLAAVALVLRDQPWLDRPAFALSALATAVLYQVVLVQAYLTGRHLVVESTLPGGESR